MSLRAVPTVDTTPRYLYICALRRCAVKSDDLSPEQAKAIHDRGGPIVGYLHRLRERMVQRGFPEDDPLLKLVSETYDKAQHLTMDLHYRSCTSGAWREREG